MTIKQIVIYTALVLGLIAPALALADTPNVTATGAAATAAAPSVPAGVSASAKFTALETKVKSRGDAEIDRRIAALNDINTRVQAMQKVTDAFKQNLTTTIQNQVSAFTALKAKIDADTDGPTLKTDLQSVTTSYRVFALILPQVRIAAAADRTVELVSMMSTLGSKLQARLQAAQQNGTNITAFSSALTDMAAKLQDAQTQASAAVTASAALAPDNGDKTLMASNAAALKQAHADIKLATTDLTAARKDIETILAGLKAASGSSASSTTEVQTH